METKKEPHKELTPVYFYDRLFCIEALCAPVVDEKRVAVSNAARIGIAPRWLRPASLKSNRKKEPPMLASNSPRPRSAQLPVAEARAVAALAAKVEALANLLNNSNGNLWSAVERLSGNSEECSESKAPRNRPEGDLGSLEEAIDRAYREAERTSALVGPFGRI